MTLHGTLAWAACWIGWRHTLPNPLIRPFRNYQAVPARLSLSDLQSCFVNLLPSLFSSLVNLNTPSQNVVVELIYYIPSSAGSDQSRDSQALRSVFKTSPPDSRDRLVKSKMRGYESEAPLIDIDAVFARTLGLSDGQDVTVALHLDPPLVETVNIEPLTPEDWEIIELHASFLEVNLVRQVRALPNPSYTGSDVTGQRAHPITLHLSPTTTANIKLVSLDPSPDSPFAKLSPNAEVIIAPKSRSTLSHSRSRTGSRGKASSSSSARARETVPVRMFFRGVDRSCCARWFEDNQDDADEGLKVWIDRDVRLSEPLKRITWVSVSILHQSSSQAKLNSQYNQQAADNGNAAWVTPKVVARLEAWQGAVDNKHAALSSSLCAALVSEGMVGMPVKIEAAPEEQAPTHSNSLTSGFIPQRLHIYPFMDTSEKPSGSLRLGERAKRERQDAAQFIEKMYKQPGAFKGLLDGPLTDGSILGPLSSTPMLPGWVGGIVRFDTGLSEPAKPACRWFLGASRPLSIDVRKPIPSPVLDKRVSHNTLSYPVPVLAGVDNIIAKIKSHLSHDSSLLLTGGPGTGKSSVALLVGHQLRSERLLHSTYISCQSILANEQRVVMIKDSLEKSFLQAALSARLGGKGLIILDDLDKLCPVETELVVGGDNARAKQMSEIIAIVIKKYCQWGSGVAVLATAQAKESMHNTIVPKHLFRETLLLGVSNKDCRRKILEMVIQQCTNSRDGCIEQDVLPSRPATAAGLSSEHDNESWMGVFSSADEALVSSNSRGHVFESGIDFARLTNLTESYMPRDLILLVERAKYVALARFMSDNSDEGKMTIPLADEHFDEALEGFTPVSLRNMSLGTSNASFDSIGGLKETRRVLLETIQYPTTYAPVFAQCPLRLRSGLLLYGYPGCGKTLLASAVAGECGLNFISVKGPEVLNKYIGASEKSIRDLFECAAPSRPCVLFDEFESIAPKRGSDSTGVTDRVMNQLLTQMDGVEGLTGVYVLAATSRPDLIDPALLRPGRLDKSLLCDLPHLDDRIDILKCLVRKLKLAEDLDDELDSKLEEIAARTEGYSGADLQALISNAQLEAIHEYLGDEHPSARPSKGVDTRDRGTRAPQKLGILRFRFGEVDDSPQDQFRTLAEYEDIILTLRSNRKLTRAVRHGLPVQDNKKPKKVNSKPEVQLAWRHLKRSSHLSQASIKADEKQRLCLLYDEFVNGRAADLRNGQGDSAIGSHETLM
ncbi:AAA-domain-containing protein [Xylaria sp. FL0064]|nr:AAA-domain-containing protein [Xylaria sp. FL0064]